MSRHTSLAVQERNALSPVVLEDSIFHSPYREPTRHVRCAIA
jgi:hypothetical protein